MCGEYARPDFANTATATWLMIPLAGNFNGANQKRTWAHDLSSSPQSTTNLFVRYLLAAISPHPKCKICELTNTNVGNPTVLLELGGPCQVLMEQAQLHVRRRRRRGSVSGRSTVISVFRSNSSQSYHHHHHHHNNIIRLAIAGQVAEDNAWLTRDWLLGRRPDCGTGTG